jgi:hypothetical protein
MTMDHGQDAAAAVLRDSMNMHFQPQIAVFLGMGKTTNMDQLMKSHPSKRSCQLSK